ncbi:MAG TPA: SusC/RagA family TonB-linked outer membrane protein [Gemmatimonadaceae bacterium]|jgi:TonB-linked SusC/RagA family outer membrane protein|nr:SusC/RagA family TonB-linked outer membrane protein [Gemmatimonadaceae bacterium]
MGRRIFLALLALSTAAATAQSQSGGRITGRVTAAEGGQPIPGVQITVTGTSRGAISDTAGRYTIVDVPAGTQTVLARRLGWSQGQATVTVTDGGAVTADFSLVAAPTQLNPLVVTGYGETDRRRVVGSVATVPAERLRDVPTENPMKALQGRVAGVEIVAANNEPGAAMNVRIRGVRSLTASNEPLFVVDGIPITGGIQDFNPQQIESIEVLKDAAATAIYGSRGANGVVLVTTRKGTRDGQLHTTYSFDSYYGIQEPVQLIPMMNLQQYVQYMQDAAAAQNQDPALDKIFTAKQLYAIENNISTDWQRAVLRDGLQRSMQGGLTGSTAQNRFALSGNWFDQKGVIPGQGYNRGAGFASLEHQENRFRVGATINASRIKTDQGEGGAAYGYALAMTPLGAPTNYMNPDSAGLLDPRPDDDPLNINPVLEAQSVVREQTVNRVFGSVFAEYRIMEGLNYRINVGPDYTHLTNGCFNNSWTHGTCANLGANSSNQGQPPQAGLFNTQDYSYTIDNLLRFDRTIGGIHRLDVTGLYSIQKDRFTKDSLYATNLPYPTQLWYDLGSGTAGNEVSRISEWALQSYMGRVNYTLLDRYTASFTARADGSSRLAPGNKWASFPSVGLAWQLGDEPFMRGLGFLNSLKLRGSWGVTGNTSINPYQTQGTLAPRLYTFGSVRVRGYRPGAIPNPDLKWEKTEQLDIGLEYDLFDSRVSGSIDVYNTKTKDLLLTRLLPVTSGFTSTLQNIGATENKGVELGLSTVNLRNWHGFTWTTDINWSKNSNEITALASGAQQDLGNVWFIGKPINIPNDAQRRVFFDYKYLGVWQFADSNAMKAFNANGSTFKFGDPRVADINGDGRITPDDRTIIGDSYPAWTGSLYNRITRGGWDFSALITAKWDYTFQDGTPRQYFGRFGNIADMDYWTPENPTNKNPAPTTGAVTRLYADSRLYRDGSHWRIRNITAGYTLTGSLPARIGIRSVRFYATAQEPYIHTDYVGIDPEVAGAVPTLRTILVGSNIAW